MLQTNYVCLEYPIFGKIYIQLSQNGEMLSKWGKCRLHSLTNKNKLVVIGKGSFLKLVDMFMEE